MSGVRVPPCPPCLPPNVVTAALRVLEWPVVAFAACVRAATQHAREHAAVDVLPGSCVTPKIAIGLAHHGSRRAGAPCKEKARGTGRKAVVPLLPSSPSFLTRNVLGHPQDSPARRATVYPFRVMRNTVCSRVAHLCVRCCWCEARRHEQALSAPPPTTTCSFRVQELPQSRASMKAGP